MNNTNELDLREIREKRGLTQRELADALGVSVATLRDVEHGRRAMSPKLCRAVDAFLAREERQKTEQPPGSIDQAAFEQLPLALALFVHSLQMEIDLLLSDLPVEEKFRHAVDFCARAHTFTERYREMLNSPIPKPFPRL